MEAAFTALASTVGTGNIIGTGQAIAMGGPGAVFWMWVAAFLGGIVKCAEIWFGQRNGRGAVGTIRSALGKRFSAFYAFLAVLSVLFVGNMAQMNTLVISLGSIKSDDPAFRLTVSFFLLGLLAAALSHGVSTLGKICSYVVPGMTALYLAVSFIILFENREKVMPCFSLIVSSAMKPGAVLGAFGGMTARKAILWGFRRGVFSNEAGLGTAGTIHSLVHSERPERHARWGLWEVGVDTLLLCSISSLTLLCSGVAIPYGCLPGAELWFRVFSSSPAKISPALVLGLCLFFFGLSTVLGCYVPGSLCAMSIGIGEQFFCPLYLACAAFGCFLPTDRIWLMSDLINVLMAVPNLLSMISLAPFFAGGCEHSKNNPEKSGIALAHGQRMV